MVCQCPEQEQMGNRLSDQVIRVITPFICALSALMHGVLYFCGYKGEIYSILGEFTGHSIFLVLYVMATSRRMCKWYRLTTKLLILPHIYNLAFLFGLGKYEDSIYVAMIISLFASVTYIVYIFKSVMKKIRSAASRRDL